ncbi:uncharacterized protein N7503_001454 [Penicillium pulvis]|uniref:uncharacterized protein n=1 Tax=Penicillium pulvis TaxID=1562058 RepID=UPI0025490019|nr:uncharacterized protein N7503_001454 [Penicillium pulvis]KAJ5809236.1 hypothetical protein N7503_001454 [Penicillium pulvis]
MTGNHSSLQTTPGPTGTIAQPQLPAISHGTGTAMGLRNVLKEPSRHPAEDSMPLSSGQSDTFLRGIDLTEEDRDILISEDYVHVTKPSNEIYESMRVLYADVSRSSPEACLPSLPSLDIIHACTQLYFEHFHPCFPILHQGTFEARSSSWLLYLVIAAVGSQYSRLSIRAKLFADLVKIVRVALLQKLNYALTMQNNLELAQTTLLFNIALLFGGSREGMMHLQYQRNVLVTMCRPLLVPGILFAKSWILSNTSVPNVDWSRWVATEAWKRVIYFTWYPQECPGVLSLLKMDVIDHERIDQLSDPALLISTVSVYVADRQASQQQSLQLLSGTHTIPNHQNVDFTESVHAARLEDTVDTILGSLQYSATECHHNSAICPIVAKLSLILRMLRFIKYRPLYLSSGWMAQAEEVRAARQHIDELLHAEPSKARQGLLHAAQLFRIIRSQRQYDPFDSFILLMVVLYIWNYDKYVVSHSPWNGDNEETLRIDQNIDGDLQEEWIAGTKRKQLHISGIGVLNGQDSMSRIIKEAMRILNHDKAWSRQAEAIKHSLHQILKGGAPSFADVEAATNETVT